MLQRSDFHPSPIEDWTRLDDMRPPGTDSAFADEEEFMGRLKTQYGTWYAQQGGDGKERIKKTTTTPGTSRALAAQPGKGKGGYKGGRGNPGRGTGRGGWMTKAFCTRCWVNCDEEGGHMVRDCTEEPKICQVCGSDGSTLSCGGEYDKSKCLVAGTGQKVQQNIDRLPFSQQRDIYKMRAQLGDDVLNPSTCLILLSETEPYYSKFYTNTEPRDGLMRCTGTIPTHPERERLRSRR